MCKNLYNFPNMHQVIYNNEYLWVSNTEVHKKANLSPTEFLKHLTHVKMLRSGVDRFFILSPSDETSYEFNIKLWKFVNGEHNILNTEHRTSFVVGFPKELYKFLKKTSIDNLFSPVLLYLVGRYMHNPKERHFFRTDAHEPLYRKMMSIVNKYFSAYIDVEDLQYNNKFHVLYRKVYKEIVGSYQLFSVVYPFWKDDNLGLIFGGYTDLNNKRNEERNNVIIDSGNLGIGIMEGYMTDFDWNKIIVNKVEDSLDRVESLKELFEHWKNDFSKHNKIKISS
jgi:hypothetical protein